MNIRWSILTLVTAVVLATQGLSYWLIRDLLVSTVNQRETEKVNTVAATVESLVAEYSEGALLAARVLSSSDRLAQALADQNTATSQESFGAVLRPLLSDNQLDILEVTDEGEIVRYRAHDPARNGDRADAWGVSEALRGKGSMVAHVTSGETSVLAIEPLRQGNKIVGSVIAGRRLNQMFIKDLAKKVGADLALVSRIKVMAASSAVASETLDKLAIEEAFHQKIPIYRSVAEGRGKVVYLPLLIVDDGFVMMVRLDSTSAYQALERNFALVLIWTTGVLIISIISAVLLLRIILKPLRVLRSRAEQTAITATGTTITSAVTDEIGAVVHVLDTLTERLLTRNEELNQSRADAQAATEAKSQFLSSMSHEIRTPLNGVLGMAELLHRTTLTPDQRKYCHAIATSGRALYELLSDILDLSKIEANKIQIEAVDFSLTQLLEELRSAFGELGAARRNRLIADINLPSPGCFRGDPARLRQVLSNLLGNAIKFTEVGTITLAVSVLATGTEDSRTWLRFSVSDSGIGIPPEKLPALFAPFAQADSSTTRRYGGSGLGLVISKHLVELLGGSIRVESTPGTGSRFWFDIPFGAATEIMEATQAIAAPARQSLTARVLIAEDNLVNQEVIKAMLVQAGAEVTTVDNGELAVQALRQRAFDVVLMDCQMPVMDGYEAAMLIRAEAAPGRRIPIVALTANAFAEDRERCIAAGMDDYLTKPVPWGLLTRTVARWAGPAAATPPAVCTTAAPRAVVKDDHSGDRSSAPGAPPTFDPAALQAALPAGMGVDSPLAHTLIGLFVGESAKLIAKIEHATAAADTQTVFCAAHSLKSSAASVGARAFSAVATDLEALARAGKAVALADHPARLHREHMRFCEVPLIRDMLAPQSVGRNTA